MTPVAGSMPMQLTLARLADPYAICRLPSDAAVPAWATGGPFLSITRTPAELSLFVTAASVPATLDQAIKVQSPWRLFTVVGPFPFDVVGVLAELARTLAEAQIPLLTISTFDTDYVATAEDRFEPALAALAARGHSIVAPPG